MGGAARAAGSWGGAKEGRRRGFRKGGKAQRKRRRQGEGVAFSLAYSVLVLSLRLCAFARTSSSSCRSLLHLFGVDRQLHRERRSLAHQALDPNPSLVLLDDLPAHAQPQ